MRLIPYFLLAGISAQSITLQLSQSSVAPGDTPTLSVSFVDASPSRNIAGIQFTLNLPPGVTAGTPQIGLAAPAKTVSCGPAACVVSGLDTTKIQSGMIASIPMIISGLAQTGPISLSLMMGADVSGNGVALTSSPVTLNIQPAVLTIFPGSATDKYFSGGAPCPSAACSSPAPMRYGPSFAYNIPLPNGLYSITAVLIEPNKTAAGQRLFTISANGQATNSIDVFAAAGLNAPYSVQLLALVGAGMLHLNFQGLIVDKVASNAIVSQISIGQVGVPVQCVLSIPAQ